VEVLAGLAVANTLAEQAQRKALLVAITFLRHRSPVVVVVVRVD
jgi:hypothetical protein